MDKYFEESYDPRLDVGPLSIPTVPSTGLVDGTEFDRWEAMLEIIRQRREDKAERMKKELSRCLNWPYLAKEVHALNEKYLR